MAAVGKVKPFRALKLYLRQEGHRPAQKVFHFRHALSPSPCLRIKVKQDIVAKIILNISHIVFAYRQNGRNAHPLGSQLPVYGHKCLVFKDIDPDNSDMGCLSARKTIVFSVAGRAYQRDTFLRCSGKDRLIQFYQLFHLLISC